MPSANDHLLIRIEIDGLVGPPPNIAEHGDLFPSYRKIGNGSWSANVDAHLTYINQTGKLSSPSPVFCVKIRRMTIRASVDDFHPLCKILDLLEATNRSKDFLLEDL